MIPVVRDPDQRVDCERQPAAARAPGRPWAFWLAAWLSVAFLLVTRWGTWTVPQLDWDEGTRMSIASALNHGRTLYVDAWDHHTFLDILFFQQLFRIFPSEWVPVAVRVCNALMVVASCLVIYGAVDRVARSPTWGLAAAVVCNYLFGREWAMSSTGEFYHSLAVALAFWLYFLGPKNPRRLVVVGLLFAVGFFTKQTALFDLGAFGVLALGSCWLAPDLASSLRSRAKEMGWLILGVGVVTALSAAYFVCNGALAEAVYMAFVDPVVYSTGRQLGDTLAKFGNAATALGSYAASVNWLITAAAAVSWVLWCVRGTAALLTRELGILPKSTGETPMPRQLTERNAASRLALGAGLWLLVDMAGLVLIGRFYPHYLVQLIVPAAIFSTSFVWHLKGWGLGQR
jgi:hypothetical protein